MFIKILTKKYGNKKHFYASLVENKRVGGKVKQTVKANLGPVTEEQIPFLKAAYAKKKPRLVYDEEE
ncbi:MAG: 2-C-methyl-D-erythritol 4-phosphate cytidylyltransferase [Bacillota bacterium]|nr:2-C-methyl-D-erythritol 4-phosphate cytidylyltransferase [Bacillota bacterium]MDW7684397.1 2-C-methyl-D-erythritol 4-phosphate cytidylyltransferase [Bacillota bacterium]